MSATTRSAEGARGSADSASAVSGTQSSAECPICTKSGATSIRSCCTGGTWDYKGNFEKHFAERDAKALELFDKHGRSESRGRAIHEGEGGVAVLRSGARRQLDPLFAPGASEPASYVSVRPRQREGDRLCLSDYVLPAKNGKRDHVALFVVTAGEGIRERSEEAKQDGRVFQGARLAGAGDRDRRRLRGMAAPADSRGLGFSRSAGDDDAGAVYFAISRQALQLRVSGVSESGGSGRAFGSCCIRRRSAWS